MLQAGWSGIACLLLVSTSACTVGRPSLNDDGPERSCHAPTLTVVGYAHHGGSLTVRPGQALRLRGTHYTDDCHVAVAGSARTIPKLQLALESVHRVGPIATVHPHGRDSSFTVTVTIPGSTFPGPARISDVLSPPHGVVRLTVRR